MTHVRGGNCVYLDVYIYCSLYMKQAAHGPEYQWLYIDLKSERLIFAYQRLHHTMNKINNGTGNKDYNPLIQKQLRAAYW